MNRQPSTELIPCPYCGAEEHAFWADEIGFAAVRCKACSLIYVNPRPSLATIDMAVRTGVHSDEAHGLNVKSYHDPRKVARYRRTFARMFDDVWRSGRAISWLDVGAGYGEIVEAVMGLAAAGSRIEGLEPMQPKAEHARARGLAVTQDYLRPGRNPAEVVSIVDVFSHIPQFHQFLQDVRSVLTPRGEVFVETGNLADLRTRAEFPGELGLPDHLVFAGEAQLRGYLDRAGFDVVRLERVRIDGMVNLAKNLVKKALGRPVRLALPYSSDYRQLLIRARLRA